MSGAQSDAFKIYFAIEARPVFDDEESYKTWLQKYERIQELEKNNEIILIPDASSLRYNHGNFKKNLERAVHFFCQYCIQSDEPWANFSNKSYKFERRCQKVREYLQNDFEKWKRDLSQSSIIDVVLDSKKERELILQLRRIASKLIDSDTLTGIFDHEVHFNKWIRSSNELSACLICVNEMSIQEWLLHRLYYFAEEIRSSKILPLNINKFGRGFEQQLLNSIASHLELPKIGDYSEEFVIDAITQRIQQSSITFIFYGLDQLSVSNKEAIWTFWVKVLNHIKSKKIELSNNKIIGLMPHSISRNCLEGKLFVEQHPPLEQIDRTFMQAWIHDEIGNDDTQVTSLFADTDFSYEQEIKESLLSVYESVDPLIRKINEYVTGNRTLDNLRIHWSLAQ